MKNLLNTRIATMLTLLSLWLPVSAHATNAMQSATSLTEAESIAKQSYHFILYKNSPYGESIDETRRLAKLNRINKEVNRLRNAYALNLPKVNKLHVVSRSRGMYNPVRDEIVFSMLNVEHTIRHEFGHVIDIKMGVNNREWKSLVKTMIDTYNYAPSEYAKNNEAEYWAESFAYITSPEYGKSIKPFPAELEAYMIAELAKISNDQNTTRMLATR
ncbi:MAG: hypothetical protein K9I59_10870 [Chlorobium sp.]|uniref:hypothetical protein n=1 Tax=Chlorobium sp. TaxID=1095 RepID=UPI0025BE8316|nr:hypothetical protein [Chlorobium sp.]MCF8217309.1 hypothetical protein [Chlorobium sp.]MCF8272157.1 hypothetical protein [Chlorobium sp.]MCF8288534.1 hypothetical protein [Chlorobium sp.]MCF8292116.1 hypothetical protein [Chlorobium sp.]